MKKPEANKPVQNSNQTDDIEQLKAQMLDMQMEIDILRETINVLKKDPLIQNNLMYLTKEHLTKS